MPDRLSVLKTFKLFINGAFPRSESGRSIQVQSLGGAILAHLCHASRKDLRDAVESASKALSGWADRLPYNRGQILYRMAEMLEGKREEFAELIKSTTRETMANTRREVDAAIDRLVCFGGWADKYAQVLGCNNPVAGPYYNFTIPQPTGVVGVVAPDEPALLGIISLIAPPLCAGNTIVAIASDAHPLPACVLAEVCATSDVPAGVINILTGKREELLEHVAMHRAVGSINAANLSAAHMKALRLGAAENVKRVHVGKVSDEQWYDADVCESPWAIEPFVDFKTIWHPSAV